MTGGTGLSISEHLEVMAVLRWLPLELGDVLLDLVPLRFRNSLPGKTFARILPSDTGPGLGPNKIIDFFGTFLFSFVIVNY